MKFVILSVVIAAVAAMPQMLHAPAIISHSIHTPTIVTQHARTMYAPMTKSAYGSQINHLVAQPAPIAIPVPEPYAVPRAIPVAVPRAVPVPMIAHAAPMITKSIVHAAPVLSHGYSHGYSHGLNMGLHGMGHY